MILRRYMTRQVATTTALVVAFLVILLLGGRMIRYFGIAAEGRLDVGLLFTIIGYNVPYFLELILPLSFFIGLMLVFGRLYVDSEMAVLNGSGISRGRLARLMTPLILVLFIMEAGLSLFAKPWGVKQSDTIWQQQSLSSAFDLIRPQSFISSDDYHLYVGSMNEDRSELQDVILIQTMEDKSISKENLAKDNSAKDKVNKDNTAQPETVTSNTQANETNATTDNNLESEISANNSLDSSLLDGSLLDSSLLDSSLLDSSLLDSSLLDSSLLDSSLLDSSLLDSSLLDSSLLDSSLLDSSSDSDSDNDSEINSETNNDVLETITSPVVSNKVVNVDVDQTGSSPQMRTKDVIVLAKRAKQVQGVDDSDKTQLDLYQGRRYEIDANSRAYNQVSFERYRISIDTPPADSVSEDNVETQTLPVLWRAATGQSLIRQQTDDKPDLQDRNQQEVLPAQAELGYRFALPWLMIIAPMLAVPLAQVRPRQGRWLRLLPAIIIYTSCALVIISLKNPVAKGTLTVWIYPMAILAFIALALYFNWASRIHHRVRFGLNTKNKGAS